MVLLARVSRGLGNVDRFGGLIASVVEYVIDKEAVLVYYLIPWGTL
jgi:hypothetical protein